MDLLPPVYQPPPNIGSQIYSNLLKLKSNIYLEDKFQICGLEYPKILPTGQNAFKTLQVDVLAMSLYALT